MIPKKAGKDKITSMIRLAEQNISITAFNPEVHWPFSDDRAEDGITFSITTAQKDIDFEREKSIREAEADGKKLFGNTSDGKNR